MDHHGILSSQYRASTSVATKKYPKILTFNKEWAKFFVATILDDQTAFGPVLVDRKDGNITGLNKGKAIKKLSITLGRKDCFMVEGPDGQPSSGVNDKLVNKVGIHVTRKKGVAHAKEKVSTGRVEPDHQLDLIPYEQMVAIAILKDKLLQSCLEQVSEVQCKTSALASPSEVWDDFPRTQFWETVYQ